MSFCNTCGKEYTDNSKFCSGCGVKLVEITNINENINENHKETVLNDETEGMVPNKINTVSDLSWDAPHEFYEKNFKLYKISPKLVDLAIRYKISEKESDIVICYGMYCSNIDFIIIFVKKDEVIIAKINEKKPVNNKIVYFPRNSVELASTYNPQKLQFDTDKLIGFKITNAAGMNIKKKYATYFEMLKMVHPQEAKNYFFKTTLRYSFKTNEEIELNIQNWKNGHKSKREVISERKNKAEENGLACCSKCGSTSLSANKKGFGIGKAVVGGVLLGPVGLIAGNINAKKVKVTCLKCGYQFKAGR